MIDISLEQMQELVDLGAITAVASDASLFISVPSGILVDDVQNLVTFVNSILELNTYFILPKSGRPNACMSGNIFFALDEDTWYVDDGSNWNEWTDDLEILASGFVPPVIMINGGGARE